MAPSLNGAGGGLKTLYKLRDEYREALDAIERTIGLVEGKALRSAKSRAGTTLAGALTHDAARRGLTANGKRLGRPPKKRVDHRPPEERHLRYSPAVKKQRRATAKFLEQFSTSTPLAPGAMRGNPRSVAALVRRAYLLKSPEGYMLNPEKTFIP